MANISIKTKLEEMGISISNLDYSIIESFRSAVGGLAISAQNFWIQTAQSKLKTSREVYINGLRQAESFKSYKTGADADIFEIQLVGKMPNNFEFGMDSFDMKTVRPGWLGGKAVKRNKKGKAYVRIPFRHSLGGTRFDYTGKAKADNLKSELRQVVERYQLKSLARDDGGNVKQGKVFSLTKKEQNKFNTGYDPKPKEVHNYLKGLVKIQQRFKDPKRGGSQLMTFRTISEDSDPTSWIHPGLSAANILPMVEDWVDKQVDRVIKVILNGGGE